jgi:hypothetical protein
VEDFRIEGVWPIEVGLGPNGGFESLRFSCPLDLTLERGGEGEVLFEGGNCSLHARVRLAEVTHRFTEPPYTEIKADLTD